VPPGAGRLRPPLCTNRHDPHFEVLTGRLLEHTVQPPQVRVQHPKATDESYMVTTDGGSSLRVTGLLEPLGGGGTALVTTLQAKLTAHNENRMGRAGELEAGDSSGLMEAIVDRAVVLTAGLSSPLPLLPGVPAVPLWQRVSEFRYPYLVRDMDGQVGCSPLLALSPTHPLALPHPLPPVLAPVPSPPHAARRMGHVTSRPHHLPAPPARAGQRDDGAAWLGRPVCSPLRVRVVVAGVVADRLADRRARSN